MTTAHDCGRECCPYREGSAGSTHTRGTGVLPGRSGPQWAAVEKVVGTNHRIHDPQPKESTHAH